MITHTLDIRKPRRAASAQEGYEIALAENEPVFVPAAHFVDDRGFSLMNQLQGVLRPEGQVNFSTQHPGVVKAWHRHAKQTDFWMCLHGHLKVGVYQEGADFAWMQITGERAPGTVIIPPPLWHGAATVGAAPAGLLYYVTHAYDPSDPDEDRRAHDSVEGFPWDTRHG
jgi:dTDP-4-dehydrorhamnose 3,5-epimerase